MAFPNSFSPCPFCGGSEADCCERMARSLKPVAEYPEPICTGCNQLAADLEEYIEQGRENDMTPEAFVRTEEGTYNRANGHFLCTGCYIAAGMPTSRNGWIAP